MLTPVPPSECMRARESASTQLDGELSELEAARLDAHLRACAECRAYAGEIGEIARELRAAPLVRPAGSFVALHRRRSRVRLQAAAAAAAVVAVAAGSSFALGRAFGDHAAPAATQDLVSLHSDTAQQHVLALLSAGKLPATGRAIAV